MKWLQVALFAVVVLVANAAAYTDAEMRQRAMCSNDYQCQDYCSCQYVYHGGPKMCVCNRGEPGNLVVTCRRKEFL